MQIDIDTDAGALGIDAWTLIELGAHLINDGVFDFLRTEVSVVDRRVVFAAKSDCQAVVRV